MQSSQQRMKKRNVNSFGDLVGFSSLAVLCMTILVTNELRILCIQQTVANIRHALDVGEAFPTGIGAHDMACALLSFFMDLPVPLIPESVAQVIQTK